MLSLFNLFVQTAHADGPPNLGPVGNIGTVTTDTSSGIITSLYTEIFTILTLLAGLLAIIFLIWYGIQYITSGGNGDKAKTARAGIINAVVGIIIVIAAYTIIRISITIGRQISTASSGNSTLVRPNNSGTTGSGTQNGTSGNQAGSGSTGGSSDNTKPTTYAITIRAVDALTNQPLSNAILSFNGNRVTTNSSGQATYNATKDTVYTISATSSSGGTSLGCQTKDVNFVQSGTMILPIPPRTEGELLECNFKAPTTSSDPDRRTITIRGLDEQGSDLDGALVSLNGTPKGRLNPNNEYTLVLTGNTTTAYTIQIVPEDMVPRRGCTTSRIVLSTSRTISITVPVIPDDQKSLPPCTHVDEFQTL